MHGFFCILNLAVSAVFYGFSIWREIRPYSMIPNLLLALIFFYLWYVKNLTSRRSRAADVCVYCGKPVWNKEAGVCWFHQKNPPPA